LGPKRINTTTATTSNSHPPIEPPKNAMAGTVMSLDCLS
jgi:hypothetical protein